jgi:hypothetical protein
MPFTAFVSVPVGTTFLVQPKSEFCHAFCTRCTYTTSVPDTPLFPTAHSCLLYTFPPSPLLVCASHQVKVQVLLSFNFPLNRQAEPQTGSVIAAIRSQSLSSSYYCQPSAVPLAPLFSTLCLTLHQPCTYLLHLDERLTACFASLTCSFLTLSVTPSGVLSEPLFWFGSNQNFSPHSRDFANKWKCI